jgi:hypothetical protein
MAKNKKKARRSKKSVLAEAKSEGSLLNESTIRRFQTLANVGALSEVAGKYQSQGTVDAGTGEIKADLGKKPTKKVPDPPSPSPWGEDPPTVSEALEDLEGEEELPPMEGEEGLGELEDLEGEGGVGEDEVEELVSAIANAITDTTGIPVSVEGEGEGEEELEDLEDLEDLEGGEGLPPGLGVEPGPEELAESQRAVQLKNYLISEVSNRVKTRVYHARQQQALQEQAYRQRAYYAQQQQQALHEHQQQQYAAAHENRKQHLAESLADRIFTRLKGKKRRK